MPVYICPNCKRRSVDLDGYEGFSTQAVQCRNCGFGFLFQLLEDYYPAPETGFVVCDRDSRVLAAGRGVFELTGYRDVDLMGRDVAEVLALSDPSPIEVVHEWGVRMRLFNAAMVGRFMTTAKMDDDVPIESKMVSRSIQSAQGQVEGRNFEIRKNVLKYDDVLNRQRQVIYDERRRVLEGEDLHEQIRHFVNDVISGYVDAETKEGFPDDWDLDRLWSALKTLYPVSVTPDEVAAATEGGLTAEVLREQLTSDAHHAYDAREAELGEEVMREVERRVVLSVLDRKWREHLYEMDYLQEGIGLRAMAQRDPLVEYQREGFQLFEAMNESIKEESVGYLFNVQVDVDQPAAQAPTVQPMSVSDMLAGSGVSSAEEAAAQDQGAASQAAPSLAEAVAARQQAADAHAAHGHAGHDHVAHDHAGHDHATHDDAASGQAPQAAEVTPTFRAKGLEQPVRAPQQLQYSAPGETGEVEQRTVATGSDSLTPEQLQGVSRNSPCPCGSGKKFKMCHGKP